MRIEEAQAELREAYAGGGVGAIWSGGVWAAAGFATAAEGVATGFAVLFFGGMTIFAGATSICRYALRRPPASKENPFGRAVLESTIAMIAMLLVAYALLPTRPELVLPIAAIAVGVHYFAFATAYGTMSYWAFAAAVTALGAAAFLERFPPFAETAFAVAAIEAAFGAWLWLRAGRA